MSYIHLAGSEQETPLCLHYHHFRGPEGALPLVLLHELGGTLETWKPFAEILGQRYNVYAFDQRGAGRSEHASEPFTMRDLAQDTIRFADAIGISGGFVLMGLAMGAVTAAHVAAVYGDRLAALILCDGTPSIDEFSSRYLLDRAERVRSSGMRVVAESSFRNAFKGMAEHSPGTSWDGYLESFICNAPISYAMHSEALAAFELSQDDFARIQAPTLVITGESDFIWSPEIGASLAERIPGAEFGVIAGAAHFPPLQQPTAVAARVLAFLDREGS